MKPKTLMLLAVAAGCGLVAMFGVQQAMQGGSQAVQVETRKVLVALESIETGSVLTEEKVTFRDMPVDSLPPEEELISSAEQYAERGARVQLFAGEVILASKLTEPGGTGNSIKIPRGMRVITIPVTETNTQSNLVSPGDRVDVLVTYRSSAGKRASTKTKTLLEYVEVFATNAVTSDRVSADEKTGRTSHVSLLLMPEQVNYVKLAESKGTLSLSWRHKLDDEFVQIRDIDEDLLEELEGTIGINDNQPLYDERFVGELDGPGLELSETEIKKEPQSAAEFVAQVDTQPTTPPVPQQVAAVMPEKPQWTLHVYDGNQASQHHFEIQDEVLEDATATVSETVNPLAETMRSLFKGKR